MAVTYFFTDKDKLIEQTIAYGSFSDSNNYPDEDTY